MGKGELDDALMTARGGERERKVLQLRWVILIPSVPLATNDSQQAYLMRICRHGQESEDPAGLGDRDRLEALIANGNTPQKHVRRARIVALAGDGIGTDEIQRRLGVSKPTIRRWRTRYVEAGVDGLCRDKTRPPGKAPLGVAMVNRCLRRR